MFEHYSVSVLRYHNMLFLQSSWIFFIAAVVCTSAQSDLDSFESSDTLDTVDNATNIPVSRNCNTKGKFLIES